MSEHTKEPWSVAEESFDNDGIHESVIRGLDGRAAISVTLEFGPNNPGMREANARRIVAAVNACTGMPTDDLEEMVKQGGNVRVLADFANDLLQQRDKLLAALEKCVIPLELYNAYGWPDRKCVIQKTKATIAEVKSQS